MCESSKLLQCVQGARTIQVRRQHEFRGHPNRYENLCFHRRDTHGVSKLFSQSIFGIVFCKSTVAALLHIAHRSTKCILVCQNIEKTSSHMATKKMDAGTVYRTFCFVVQTHGLRIAPTLARTCRAAHAATKLGRVVVQKRCDIHFEHPRHFQAEFEHHGNTWMLTFDGEYLLKCVHARNPYVSSFIVRINGACNTYVDNTLIYSSLTIPLNFDGFVHDNNVNTISIHFNPKVGWAPSRVR